MIYKYTLQTVGNQMIRMPQGARILSAKNQNGNLCIWALVNPSSPDEERWIDVLGTGHAIDSTLNRTFIDTVVLGSFVWHVFERIDSLCGS